MVDLILKEAKSAVHLDRVYETDMAEGLKAMALEGHGIAFLPHSAVKKDVRAKKLVSALPQNLLGLQITMEVRAYRERPTSKEPARSGMPASRASGVTVKRSAQALWEYLAQLNAV
jgi:DNA-binding transcriptional LysR family regulator